MMLNLLKNKTLIFFLILLVAIFFLRKKTDAKRIYDKAQAYYQDLRYSEGLKVIAGYESDMQKMPSGCSLILSLGAQKRDFSFLKKWAPTCINGFDEDTQNLAGESLSFAYTETGELSQGLKILEKFFPLEKASPRILAMYAHFYYFMGEMEKSQKIYEELINKASEDQKTYWWMRASKYKKFIQNQSFMNKITPKGFTKTKTM